MGRLLDKLLESSPAYDIRQDKDGFVLIGKPGHIDEFSDLVREAADHAGEEFVVFTTSDGAPGLQPDVCHAAKRDADTSTGIAIDYGLLMLWPPEDDRIGRARPFASAETVDRNRLDDDGWTVQITGARPLTDNILPRSHTGQAPSRSGCATSVGRHSYLDSDKEVWIPLRRSRRLGF